ncbi:MAG: apolipoprotein N-acyltransferase [Sphingobacteriales bacterium]|nr:apolipoprotein N-acyltransferase [Sphingobacteriales bacterium]
MVRIYRRGGRYAVGIAAQYAHLRISPSFTQKPLIRNFPDAIKAYIQLVWKPALLFLLPVLVSLAIYYSYSEQGKAIEVAVLQPNIDPYNEKFEPQLAQQQLERFIQLSDSICTEHTTYMVWPETSIPNSVWRRDFFRSCNRAHCSMAATTPTTAISGRTYAFGILYGGQGKLPPPDLCAAAIISTMPSMRRVQMQGTQQPQFYYKSKLVRCGAYALSVFVQILDNFAIDLGGIAGSLGTQTERTAFIGKDGIGVAPVICYESIYGEYCTEYIKKGANAIFIITNDGWWGNTPGHRQHLHYASLRAIETRRDIARSANTGISCFIDQRGIIRQATNYDEEKVIKDTLYANEALTFYVRFGDYIYKIACGAGVVLILLLIIIKKSNRRNLSRTV